MSKLHAFIPRGLRTGLAGLALLAATLFPLVATSQTYTSASTSFAFINSSSHTKVGYNTAPYKFNAAPGCATTPPVLDDTLSDAIPIGFTFTFGTNNYTSAYIMSNGRLQFGNTTCGAGTQNIGPPQTYPYGYPDPSMNNTMKVFGVDLDPTNLVDVPNYPSSANKTPCTSSATCYVSYATLGAAPARQFVVTWKSVPEWVNSNNTSGGFDLQIILNEDGSFVYQYGNNFQHGGTGTAQVGWQLSTGDYQVLSFGASVEPSANSAIKFFLPGPIATYAFDESAWLPATAGQVRDSNAGARHGQALGDAQTTGNGKVCRAADIPSDASNPAAVNAVRTGLNLGDSSLNLQGTGTLAFWYRSNAAWNSGTAAQLVDATAVAGQWFYLTKAANGALVFVVTDSTGVLRSVTTPAQGFAANTWVHIALVWNFNGLPGANHDQLQIFINAGTPTTSAFTSSASITSQAGYLYLGDNPLGVADASGTLNSANGQLDEVQVFNYVLTQAQVNTAMNATHACPSYVIHHLELQHSSGNGLTCTPSTVTVRACADAACSSLYTGGLSGVFGASGTPTINWDGSTGNGSGSRFVIGSGSSSVTKNFQITTPGSLLLGTASTSPTASAGTTCNFGSPSCTFSTADSGFILSVPNHTAEQAQTLGIQAVRKSDNSPICTPAFANVTKVITLSCSYLNPSSGTLPVRIAGTPLATSATSACTAGGATLHLAFDATGKATTSLLYADVGQVAVAARYAPTSGVEAGLVMLGSSSFIAKPAGFTLSNIQCSATGAGNCSVTGGGSANPGASSSSGAAFIPAGRAFSATVTAVNALNAATPNYGKESPAEGVQLSASLVQPAGGSAGTLANASGFGSFNGGSATGTSFNWSEVGIITLTPAVANGDYLGAGNVSGPASGNVGRFVPAGFALTPGAITHRSDFSCSPASTFTYLGENFTVAFTLTARNAGGTTTVNYTGGFARLPLGTPAGFNLAGIAGTTMFKAGGRLSTSASSGSWATGVATVSLTANAARAAAADGPFDSAQFGIAPVDPDGVGMLSLNLDTDSPANGVDSALLGTIPLRYGRLRLQNGLAAANRSLLLPLTAQYWDSTTATYKINNLDSCTRVTAANLSLGNFRKSLTAADVVMNPASVTVNPAPPAAITFNAPSGGRLGSVDVAIALGAGASPTDASCMPSGWRTTAASSGANLAALRGAWCGGNSDPSARATWGLYRGSDGVVYQRENY